MNETKLVYENPDLKILNGISKGMFCASVSGTESYTIDEAVDL